jgi:hypothetical protein
MDARRKYKKTLILQSPGTFCPDFLNCPESILLGVDQFL